MNAAPPDPATEKEWEEHFFWGRYQKAAESTLIEELVAKGSDRAAVEAFAKERAARVAAKRFAVKLYYIYPGVAWLAGALVVSGIYALAYYRGAPVLIIWTGAVIFGMASLGKGLGVLRRTV